MLCNVGFTKMFILLLYYAFCTISGHRIICYYYYYYYFSQLFNLGYQYNSVVSVLSLNYYLLTYLLTDGHILKTVVELTFMQHSMQRFIRCCGASHFQFFL